MRSAESETKASPNPPRVTLFALTMGILVIASCSLAISGQSLMNYQITDNEPLSYLPNRILPSPGIEYIFNASLDVGSSIDRSIRIAYDKAYASPTFFTSVSGLLVKTPPIEYDVTHGQRWFVFLGLVLLTKGIINWTIHGPLGDTIATETYYQLSTAIPYVWYLIETHGNGTYLLSVNNMNQSQFDMTISLGFSLINWNRPGFLVGIVASALAIGCIVSLAIVAAHHGKRNESGGARK